MLTRPLAYKGPNDHLSQLFPLPTLYSGMHLLLNEMLMDWQYLKEEQLVQGVFLFADRLIKTRLAWPLDIADEKNICDCAKSSGEDICSHLAALAIESKVHNDRLPPPLKQNENFSSEWQYLSDWISKQQFDPFPNMARHRVIYLLDGEPGNIYVTIHKAYLTQQNEYVRKAELDLSIINNDKLPKFVSLTDQQILNDMQFAIAKSGDIKQITLTEQADSTDSEYLNRYLFQTSENHHTLSRIVASGRCFWRSCHRHALAWHTSYVNDEDWWPISNTLYLDRAGSRVVNYLPISSIQKQQHQLFSCYQPETTPVKPRLTISTKQIGLPWHKQTLHELDIAEISFEVSNQAFSLQDLMIWYQISTEASNRTSTPDDTSTPRDTSTPGDTTAPNDALPEKVAGLLHQLDWVPSIQAGFEQPISQNFDISCRYLDDNLAHWFPLLRGLNLEGWQICFSPEFRLNRRKVDDWYSHVSAKDSTALFSTDDWFEVEVGVKVDGESVNLLPYIVDALRKGQLNFSTEKETITIALDGQKNIEISQARVKSIVDILLELAEQKPLSANQKLRLPVSQLVRIKMLETKMEQAAEWGAQELERKAKVLAQSNGIATVTIPTNVHAQLRDYQQRGVDWLQFLANEGLSGILADDMGLGKTLQTLTHIQLEKNSGRMQGPCVVVAPTSLLGNWQAEAAKFTPELSIINWAGNQRHRLIEKLADVDLIITSYGLLLRDAEKLNQVGIHLLVLDEAQAIKNSRSKITRIAFEMSSKHRLCLTGTPLENHLGELWSLFHFLMPGLLGDQAQFKRLFQIPIEKENDWQRQQQLSQRIAPFMLRRTKNKVAADLPAKSEIAEFIELSESQTDLYETVRMSMLEEVQKAITQNTKGGNQLLIGNALLRLRQICCHPGLVEFGRELTEPENSSKMIWLQTTLPELIQSGRKVLIFSSFTSMLDIIAQQLEQMDIRYLMLTGQSRHRSELVSQFQNGDTPVFLISLKAGGAGLNLTSADTVIHFDPWWNPAAEDQASDRTHRIGQDKPVFIYKLITKGTVEERIYLMQKHKSQLAKDLYQQNELAQSLSKPDWEALLAPLGDS
ncbi:DEAD/DEAH box helicase [Aliikangiella coralliicola]|uniref:DEAD/DEAH box helicase n=1 Tax=Aliikangiella coralliicola TaxID=2592383 RepID=A0A545UIB4_9GAMM|nr:DEAD/DEAH box helicase [Aliikangiella coralliicola]TQV89200.1 DEAD/DEAH box helicase [Aliikangiella coralliicola]